MKRVSMVMATRSQEIAYLPTCRAQIEAVPLTAVCLAVCINLVVKISSTSSAVPVFQTDLPPHIQE